MLTQYILQGGVRWYANCPRVLGVVSQFRVLRTGMLFEIRSDNMYQPM
jgi:hypothetical protein